MDRPPPLRTDPTSPFAHYSMRVRVPRIARDVLDRNADSTRAMRVAVERLASEIEADAPLPEPEPPGPDVAAWSSAAAAHRRESWLATQWFFAELFFYRQLMQACRYWQTGRDPFRPVKEEELAGERPWEVLGAALGTVGSEEERLEALLGRMLWGNRVDLSYAVGLAHGGAVASEDLLVDDRKLAVERLVRADANVHVVADNAGTELVLDLAMVDALVVGRGRLVTLHLKMQPVFVSDATVADVWRTMERMRERGGDVAKVAARLEAAFADERLRFAPDPFWTGPHFLWEMPAHLRASFSSATMVLFKGDANYRRVIGDAIWPPGATFARACSYFPAPALCVRTMKSDPLVGVDFQTVARLDAENEGWRIDGKRGVIQAYVPA